MRKLGALVGAALLCLTSQAVAETDDSFEESAGLRKSSGYGSAGCGLGSLLFEPSNEITQIFAATTNGTSGTQTFGITSGTSNCDGSGYSGGSAAVFVETNRSALAKDAARGKGATIAGLTSVAGCKSAKAVGRSLQRQFKTVFSSAAASDAEISENVLRVLKEDKSLACTHII